MGVGYGPEGADDTLALFPHDGPAGPHPGFHVAFVAPSRQAVDAFHAAALTAGGTCNGAPGPRPDYGAAYNAAFVVDPDGHHMEAVHQ